MSPITTICLLVSIVAAQGTVYRSIDEAGNVRYSDRPSVDAEALKLKVQPGYKAAELPEFTPQDAASSADQDSFTYHDFTISQPQQDSAFWDGAGNVQIALLVDPPLQPDHRIRLLLDEEVVGEIQTLTASLTNIDRGTHTLLAEIVDSDHQIIAKTPTTTFHLHRASIK